MSRVFDVTVINLVVMVINLFLGILTARVLGPSEKGISFAIIQWADILGYLAGMGIPQAFSWFYRGEVNKQKLFYKCLLYSMCSFGIFMVIGIPLVWYFLGHLGTKALFWAEISILLLPMGGLTALSQIYMLGKGIPIVTYRRVSLAQAVLNAVVLIILALGHNLVLDTYLAASLTISLLTSLTLFIWAVREIRKEPVTVENGLPEINFFMRRSVSFFIPSLTSLFNAKLDILLCSIWLTHAEIGIYGVAISSLAILGSLSGSFCSIFFPSMAQGDPQKIMDANSSAFRVYLIVITLTGLAVVLFAAPLIQVFYGSQYNSLYPVLICLLPVGIFNGLLNIIFQSFYSLGKTRSVIICEVVGGVSGFLVISLLAPRMGVMGVALANSLSYALAFASCLLIWRQLGGTLASLVPTMADAHKIVHFAKNKLGLQRKSRMEF